MFHELEKLVQAKELAECNLRQYLENDFWQWFDGAKNLVPLKVELEPVLFNYQVNIYLPNQLDLSILFTFLWPIAEVKIINNATSLKLSMELTPNLFAYFRDNQKYIYEKIKYIESDL